MSGNMSGYVRENVFAKCYAAMPSKMSYYIRSKTDHRESSKIVHRVTRTLKKTSDSDIDFVEPNPFRWVTISVR